MPSTQNGVLAGTAVNPMETNGLAFHRPGREPAHQVALASRHEDAGRDQGHDGGGHHLAAFDRTLGEAPMVGEDGRRFGPARSPGNATGRRHRR